MVGMPSRIPREASDADARAAGTARRGHEPSAVTGGIRIDSQGRASGSRVSVWDLRQRSRAACAQARLCPWWWLELNAACL